MSPVVLVGSRAKETCSSSTQGGELVVRLADQMGADSVEVPSLTSKTHGLHWVAGVAAVQASPAAYAVSLGRVADRATEPELGGLLAAIGPVLGTAWRAYVREAIARALAPGGLSCPPYEKEWRNV